LPTPLEFVSLSLGLAAAGGTFRRGEEGGRHRQVPGCGAPASPTASATNFANLTGFPDLIVPAGFTGDNLPVGISFFGLAFSEQKLLSLGFSFEQATQARRRPVHAPALEGEAISVP
jgi:amidase